MPNASSITRLGLPFFGVARAEPIAVSRPDRAQPIAASKFAVTGAIEDQAATIRRRADALKAGRIAPSARSR